MDIRVKQENLPSATIPASKPAGNGNKTSVIDLCNSDDDNYSDFKRNPDEIADIESAERTGDFSPDVSRTFQKRARSDNKDTPAQRLAVMSPDEEERCGQVTVALPAMPCSMLYTDHWAAFIYISEEQRKGGHCCTHGIKLLEPMSALEFTAHPHVSHSLK
ncbi:hypothetical protein Bca4012_044258 [Brassica carinata]|uniref:(rape) hypothetical protein n=1 Tax=Brassica napus TaxID=3708 RepID=A0A816IV11_BRANA|nr:unnamed protein product [Brassica napus]